MVWGPAWDSGDSCRHAACRATHEHKNGQVPHDAMAHNPLTELEIVPNCLPVAIFKRVHSITLSRIALPPGDGERPSRKWVLARGSA